MKKTNAKWLIWAGFALAAVTFVAWKSTDTIPAPSQPRQYPEDTTPVRKKSYDKYDKREREYRMGDLDGAMRELDRAMLEMNRNIKIDFSKMDKEMKAAMEEIKKVDFEKIGQEVAASLKNIDWDKTRVEVDRAMREAEIKIKEIDMKQIGKEMAMVKESVEAARIGSHIDMDGIKESVAKGLEAAKIGLAQAKKEISLLKEFTEALEKDGLINKKKGFRIEIKNNEMYINGTKQSKEVNDKYKKYFKDEDYTLRNDGEDISYS